MPSPSRARLGCSAVRPRGGARSEQPGRPAASLVVLASSVGAFGCVAFPQAGWAQCNSNPNPPPAASPSQTNFANQSFGTTPPLTPYILSAPGIVGCTGAEGGYGQSGGPGVPGQQGGPIVGTNTGLTIIGGGPPDFNGLTIGASLSSSGGGGGAGGFSGYVSNSSTFGGNGAVGGAGGQVTVRFDANFVPAPGNTLATFGLVAKSYGGKGGDGGTTDPGGEYPKYGGDAGAGGSGGQVALVASGSVTVGAVGVTAQTIGGDGGSGGFATHANTIQTTHGGAGGDGGPGGSASVQWQSGTITADRVGVEAATFGGSGGHGGDTEGAAGAYGGDAGKGGDGGTASAQVGSGAQVTVNLPATNTIGGAAVSVSTLGGQGGDGGRPGGAIGAGGGNGGQGGAGGTASATVLGTLNFGGVAVPSVVSGEGVLVQSNGGRGGQGGAATGIDPTGGGGGYAGAGGSASLALGDASSTAVIRTSGSFAHGALVQSVGGAGGNGGNANFVLSGLGGAGAPGGDGGPVTITADKASVIVTGSDSSALIAQSVGGGGGAGGNATGGFTVGGALAIGGNGGFGGNGTTVQVNLGQTGVFASTSGQGGAAGAATTLGGGGVLAQSIGGSGGYGGSASAVGVGLISLVIGGDAKGGGVGGPVTVTNGGALVTTYGDHAAGIEAQSIGGGGGKGGSAFSFTGGVVPTGSVAVGGRGGGGGAAGDVSVINTGQITTYGANAEGILAQSTGGGGGDGGAAAARAVAISPSQYIPAISVSVATGGLGGAGNTGGTVTLNNSGLITTAGDSAFGVMAQSIGGGGGTGGDATAASYSNGPQAGVNISVSVAVGGSGGSGGTGGPVNLTNSGLIATLGQDAYGVFAQSVGGGGGAGGAGDATAVAAEAKNSFSVAIGVGGSGGTGGNGGTVGLSNAGAIATSGDMAVGVFAQSVGGGGGVGHGGTATTASGSTPAGSNLSVSVGVGGSGGAGGDGNTVTLSNSGSIVTRGTDSKAMVAQSVGGGGGSGGKGGATAGGVNPDSSAKALFDTLAGGLNFGQKVTDVGNGILQIGIYGQELKANYKELEAILSQPQATLRKIGTATKLNVAVSVGGSGGAAGVGGAVNVTNTGAIGTFGAQSDGIYAQSIGGGGGDGGAATSTGKAANDTPAQTSVAVGGNGGGGGRGGTVTVVNGTGGTILTQGVLAFGIYAQSVGAGGGDGVTAGTVDGSLKSLGIAVGGSGGGGGDGGDVSVTTGDGTSGSSITTTGKHGIGIYAQSVGGGGGLARTMTTDQTFDPAKIINNPQGRVADIHGLSLSFGGRNGSSGRGGQVQVTVSGPITTGGILQDGTVLGLDAHGILAQSIGGGGGLEVGGQVELPPGGTGGAGGGNGGGDGGPVILQLKPGTAIGTSGDGAHGIIAQSIGGGGGFAGDPSAVRSYRLGTGFAVLSNAGNGGAVSVSLNGASVATSGAYAPAIFAQSVGGGGGLVNYSVTDGSATKVQARGTAGGSGAGGAVTVSLASSAVAATGLGSAGILAQSDGTSRSAIKIDIDKQSSVRGGTLDPNGAGPDILQRDVAAIRLLGGTGNTITNAGTIEALAGPAGTGFAVLADGPVAITNTGTIHGYIHVPSTSTVLDNRAGGVIDAPTTINLGGGLLRNAGTLHVGGIGTVGQTTITGDLVQTSTGAVVVDVGAGANSADHLQVNGRVTLAGTVVPVVGDPANLKPGTKQVNILTATGGVVQGGQGVQRGTPVVRYDLAAPDANDLNLSYTVDFAGSDALQAQGLTSSNRGEVGRALNAILATDAGGGGLAVLGGRLAGLGSAQGLASTLDALSGEAVADVQQTVFATQQVFTGTVLRHVVTENRAGTVAPYAVASLDPVAGPPANDRGMRVWVAGFGGSDVLSGTDGQGSLHTQIAGALIGLDKWFGADRMVGLSVGGGSTDFSVADRASTGHATSANVGAYGLARFGQGAYVAGVVSYGNYASDVRRSALGGATGLSGDGRASVSSNVLGGRAELGWRRPVGAALTLTPFAALEVVHLWQAPLTETTVAGTDASALALRYKGAEQTSVPLTLGGRVSSTIALGGERVLSLSAELGWVHEFSPQRSVTAAFVAAPAVPFRVLGVSASRDSALTGLDAKLSLTRNVALLASFTGRFSGVETAVGGFGGVQVTW